jgi:hypothetical protein
MSKPLVKQTQSISISGDAWSIVIESIFRVTTQQSVMIEVVLLSPRQYGPQYSNLPYMRFSLCGPTAMSPVNDESLSLQDAALRRVYNQGPLDPGYYVVSVHAKAGQSTSVFSVDKAYLTITGS